MFDPNDKNYQFSTPTEGADIIAKDLSPRDIRTVIFYLLYAMETFDYEASLESIVDNFYRGFHVIIEPENPLLAKTAGIVKDKDLLDEELVPLLANWRLERLGVCTRLILRLALWELKNTDIAPSIIINEAIELAKCFAEIDAYKFINGVLDQWIKRNKPEVVIELAPEQEEED